jgi:hypothetical protein
MDLQNKASLGHSLQKSPSLPSAPWTQVKTDVQCPFLDSNAVNKVSFQCNNMVKIILCWLKHTGKTDRYVEWLVAIAAERPLDLLVMGESLNPPSLFSAHVSTLPSQPFPSIPSRLSCKDTESFLPKYRGQKDPEVKQRPLETWPCSRRAHRHVYH